MATWPATLPDGPLATGYQETLPDVLVRTQMDEGPDKVRRWGTAAPYNLSCQFYLTNTQLATFKTFFNTTLSGGATTFTWTHPVTSASITCRFVGPPRYSTTGVVNSVNTTIEVLP